MTRSDRRQNIAPITRKHPPDTWFPLDCGFSGGSGMGISITKGQSVYELSPRGVGCAPFTMTLRKTKTLWYHKHARNLPGDNGWFYNLATVGDNLSWITRGEDPCTYVGRRSRRRKMPCRIVFRKSAKVDCCNSTQSFFYVPRPKPHHYWQHTSLHHVSYYYSKLKYLPYNSGGTLLTFSMILPTPKAEFCSFWPQKRKLLMMMMKGAAPIIVTSYLQALILLTWTVKQQWLLSLLAQIQRISFDQDLVHYDVFFN